MFLDVSMITILLVCSITDLRNRKIYNNVLLPGFLISVIYHGWESGLLGLGQSLFGTVIGILVLFVPFALGGMGAGDVKLLGLIGAWKGTIFVLYTAFYMAILGGLLAVIIILFQKGWFSRFKGYVYFVALLRQGKYQPEFIQTRMSKLTYPYGLAIVAGAFCSLWFRFLEVM